MKTMRKFVFAQKFVFIWKAQSRVGGKRGRGRGVRWAVSASKSLNWSDMRHRDGYLMQQDAIYMVSRCLICPWCTR